MSSKKRLIFTVTSGRSGTAYLTHLLTGLPDVVAVHEAKPHFGSILPAARSHPEQAKEFLKKIKLPHIASMSGKIYVETSHYFAKGFLEPLLELDVVPDLILLRRQPRKIASSWYLIGGKIENLLNGKISRHIIGPNEPNFLPVREWRHWNDYQLCYWYALETYFRMKRYAPMVTAQGGRVFETHLKPLSDGKNYTRLLEWLEMPADIIALRAEDKKLRSQVVNDKSRAKQDKAREQDFATLDLDALEAGVHRDCGLPENIEELLRGPIDLC